MSCYKDLGTSTATVLSHFCNKTIYSDNLLSNYLVDILARQIADSYKVIDGNCILSSGENFSISVGRFDCDQYANNGATTLVDIYKIVNNEANSLFSDFYLHGSMATLDYVHGWSDVDILAVIPREVLTDRYRLILLRNTVLQINEIISKICTFQHHGVMLITEYDLQNYTGHILPTEVFGYMKSMKKGKSIIKGRLLDDVQQKTNKFFRVLDFIGQINKESVMKSHAYNDEYLLSEYRNAENGMYQFKYYIEQFMLLPALYLSSKGQDCYKKYSFDAVRDVFPSEAIEWIDLVSKVRSEWEERPYDYQSNRIPDWVRRLVPKDYFQVGDDVATAIKNKLL